MATTEERQTTAARNQSLFRDVNERIEAVFVSHAREIEVLCECADRDCTEALRISIEEYEAVRTSPTHFVVTPGHVLDDVERIVEENGRYAVVEKFERGGVVAAKLDPRSRPKTG